LICIYHNSARLSFEPTNPRGGSGIPEAWPGGAGAEPEWPRLYPSLGHLRVVRARAGMERGGDFPQPVGTPDCSDCWLNLVCAGLLADHVWR